MLISLPQTKATSADDVGFTINSDINNPDLKGLASSLGADTDHFNFANYNATFKSDDIKNKFVKNISKVEALINKIGNADSASKGGVCNGISILQVLVHNGIISASDIQEGAEKLVDVKFDDSINDVLSYYQMGQVYMHQDLFTGYYFCNHDTSDAIADIVKEAEKAMAKKKYFYIALLLPTFAHAVTGIGIADGIWEIEGRTYNKCILTLDSNYVGFNEKGCIYVNTEDNTFCFPTYKQTEKESFIRAVSSDESWMNYKGLISPSNETKTDISNISKIEIDSLKVGKYDLIIQDGDSIKSYSSNGKNPILEITPNNFINFAEGCYQYYINASNDAILKLAAENDPEKYEEGYIQLFNTNETSRRYCYSYGFSDKTNIEIGPTYINIDTQGFNKYVFDLISEEGLYKTSKFCHCDIGGQGKGPVSVTERTDGILLKTDSTAQCMICFSGPLVLDDGTYKYDTSGMNAIFTNFTSNKNTMIRYDEEMDMIRLFFDNDGDDVYDDEVKKGDVNGDDYIDAVDASIVLAAYAKYSTEEVPYIPNFNDYYGDFDGNNIVDAVDASKILAEYAKKSVVT